MNEIHEFEKLLACAKDLSAAPKTEHLMSDVFNKAWNENFNSDWLAFILNPHVNSVGMAPLNALLSLYFQNAGKTQDYNELTENADVDMGDPGSYSDCREQVLDDHNRIDFLFTISDATGNYLVAIENKIGSGLSKNDQLEQYEQLLNGYIKNEKLKGYTPIYIYLTLSDKKPEPYNGSFVPIAHWQLVNEFKKIPTDPIKHLRESFLIKEYINNMEERIMDTQSTNFTDEEIKLLGNNAHEIDVLYGKKTALAQQIRQEVYKYVEEKLFEGYCTSGTYTKEWFYFYKSSWPWSVHYEILFYKDKDNKCDVFDKNGNASVCVCFHTEHRNKGLIDRLNLPNYKEQSIERKICSQADIKKLCEDVTEKMCKIVNKTVSEIDKAETEGKFVIEPEK